MTHTDSTAFAQVTAGLWRRVAGFARRSWRGIRIGLRAARILATSRALPWPLRVLLVLGCIQVPFLPADELCLAVALGWLFLRHRGTLRDALGRARRELGARRS